MLTPVDPGSLLSEEGDQPLACQGKQNNVACPACKTVPEELKSSFSESSLYVNVNQEVIEFVIKTNDCASKTLLFLYLILKLFKLHPFVNGV